jgi:hypothetical protein
MADVAALNLQDKALKPDTSWQAALAASLPKGATADGRTVLLADGDGYIKARAPLDGTSGNLLTILGPQQPLTIFGADAGVLEIALADDTDAIVTVRDVPKTDAQLAFVQPVDEALADWRSAASLELTLLICTGLVLALYAGGLFPVAASGDGISRAGTSNGPRRCTGCLAWSLPAKPFRSVSSPRHCIPRMTSAARSTAISATASHCSTAALGCAMPMDIGCG